MSMISDTFALRKQYGKMHFVDASSVASYEHVSFCQACGSSKPEKLVAVSGGGWSGMVGSTCAGILTSGKNPSVDTALLNSGETYQDGDRVYVYPTLEWKIALGNHIFQVGENRNRFGDVVTANYETNYNGAYRTLNYSPFLSSVYDTARKYGKVSVKQFEAVNKSTHINQ